MSVPAQHRRLITDWRAEYHRVAGEEVATETTRTAWSWGWAEGHAFALREAGVQLDLVEEITYRLVVDAHVRKLTAELTKSVPFAELERRRYPGTSPERLAELRGLVVAAVPRVRDQHVAEGRWAA